MSLPIQKMIPNVESHNNALSGRNEVNLQIPEEYTHDDSGHLPTATQRINLINKYADEYEHGVESNSEEKSKWYLLTPRVFVPRAALVTVLILVGTFDSCTGGGGIITGDGGDHTVNEEGVSNQDLKNIESLEGVESQSLPSKFVEPE